jgi:hypothetical protein
VSRDSASCHSCLTKARVIKREAIEIRMITQIIGQSSSSRMLLNEAGENTYVIESSIVEQ